MNYQNGVSVPLKLRICMWYDFTKWLCILLLQLFGIFELRLGVFF